MEKRRFENLGIETSLLGFGCMRFPTTEDGRINETEAEKMLDEAIARGVTYIDTAYFYHDGQSEPFVGKALKKYDRDSYYLATKLPLGDVNNVEDAERIFHHQLERLQTDYIDFYLLHAVNREKWEISRDNGVVSYCERLKEEGKIKYFGFSFHDDYDVFEEILRYRNWDFCQIQLNYKDTGEQAGMKGYCLSEELGVPLVIMEPVKGGSLAGFTGEIADKFHALDSQKSIASYALRWVGSLPNVKVILSGMTTMEQVEDNLATFDEFRTLDDKERSTIDEVVAILESRIQNGCTGCRYCMPCPAGVDIPRSFELWNTYHVYQKYEMVKNGWEKHLDEACKPSACIRCGKCEKLCPQKLSIRQDLEKVQSDLDVKVF